MANNITLHYNFKNKCVRDVNELIVLHTEDFPFEVSNDNNLTEDELIDKYWDDAAELALYKEMSEFADFIVK